MKTTFETNREEKHKETVNVLQGIIEKNYDAEKGYKKAMEDAKNPALKGFLQDQAARRSRFATAIDQKLRQLGETPKEKGSTTGTLHRAWIDIKSSLAGNDDEAVLEEVIRGEKASVDEYQDVLNKHTLSPEITHELQTQLGDIQGTLNKVKRLEDIQS
ncbi:PA2169 family four-helix-bundle protein [Subsaxibacter sp. CAU 1640]|uniref:ferritin-like domain-containing protein n=1 Tax=Subsaxibacter sp. CAU 1640 TaxID=2933271 RepID=UPI0020056176|nr:PA2169 family four-helix-bundle protein [Subsaxibacter sp. CAU 1640]MCK7589635.1 PA2169 family four-helix-bundle protein [Subsaxibacter sp. CAU 1640]